MMELLFHSNDLDTILKTSGRTIILTTHYLEEAENLSDRIDKLITSLRTAVDIDGTLDKEATSYNDTFNAFRLALKFYRFEERID